jgi:GAF domain-containing protein
MADTSGPENESFLALSEFFVDDGTLGDVLLRVSQLACRVAPADMAGITMLVEGNPRTGVFTDAEAPEIDEAQYGTGQGPCLDAFRHQRVYRIDSTADEVRWPDFARTAAAYGIVATLSVPIVARGEGLGALNLYTRQSSGFDDAAAARVSTFAAHAAIVLANAQVYSDARQLSENLNQAMSSRATIDYAVGILMAHGGRSPEDAFQLLVRASQRENRKLREVAGAIVERAARRQAPPTLN